MIINTFLQNFELLANVHDSVPKLRELILDLTVRGKLVPQDPADEPAERLLEVGEKRRKELIKAGLKGMPKVSADLPEDLYHLPDGWCWAKVGKITQKLGAGSTPKGGKKVYQTSGIKFLRSQNIWNEGLRLADVAYIPEETHHKMQGTVVHPGDVLLNITGASIGRSALVPMDFDEANVSQHVAIVRPIIQQLNEWIHLYLISPVTFSYIMSVQVGISREGLSMTRLKDFPIPLPPLAEQKRIIAKVDELMALCDKLEAQQQDREALCKITRKTVLYGLSTAKNSKDLAVAWNRAHDNFKLWLDNEDSVTELKYAVIFLGCCGFLSETNPSYITESNIKKVPLPTGWSWKTLDQLSEYITSGSRGWRKYMASQGDIFIRSQDIKYDTLIFEDRVFVNLPEQVEGMRTLVRPGDLLMTITGANVGKCAQVPKLNQKAYVSQHVALIKIEDSRNAPFLHWWITNNFGGRKHLAQYIYGDKPGLNLTQVRNIPIPLPPQEVQDRIVEALEHYKTLFDRLASQVQEAQNTGELLTSAAVASITGIQIEDKEKMKVPKTELVSTLRIGVSPANSERAPLVAILIRNNGEMSAKTLWQASGLEIDAFYQRLKTEMARGWIIQPEVAYVREMEAS